MAYSISTYETSERERSRNSLLVAMGTFLISAQHMHGEWHLQYNFQIKAICIWHTFSAIIKPV